MDWHIDFRSDTPVFKQIKNVIRQAINSGELAPGDQLPSVREIAERCGVNANTAAHAIRELQLQGVVYSRRGSGVFVNEPSTSDDGESEDEMYDTDDSDDTSAAWENKEEESKVAARFEPSLQSHGNVVDRVFGLLAQARSEAEAAGMDWAAMVQLFNSSRRKR